MRGYTCVAENSAIDGTCMMGICLCLCVRYTPCYTLGARRGRAAPRPTRPTAAVDVARSMPNKTALSSEKGAPPAKKKKKAADKEHYFPSPASGGGWPSRHDRTAAPIDEEATAEAAAAAHGQSAKPTIWDLSLVPPKWAPPALVAGKASPATSAALEAQASKALRKLRSQLTALCVERGMSAKVRKLTIERWRFAAKREEEEAYNEVVRQYTVSISDMDALRLVQL